MKHETNFVILCHIYINNNINILWVCYDIGFFYLKSIIKDHIQL